VPLRRAQDKLCWLALRQAQGKLKKMFFKSYIVQTEYRIVNYPGCGAVWACIYKQHIIKAIKIILK
jgi:hypothetical protein